MKLSALLPGQVELLETEITDSENHKVIVRKGEYVSWENYKFLGESDRLPIVRLVAQNGSGPFCILRIFKNPTGSIYFEFLNKKKELKRVNKNYFAK